MKLRLFGQKGIDCGLDGGEVSQVQSQDVQLSVELGAASLMERMAARPLSSEREVM